MRVLPISSYIPTVRGLVGNFFSREAIFPFYASFKITSRCHFGCPFCNMRAQRVADLPTGDIIKVLDNLSRSPVLMTSFEGGEPLLREDIGELLRYARRCNFYLLFTTSVRNLDKYPLEDYCRCIDFFHVSIDEGHDNLEMFDMLPRLMRLPTQVSVQTVVTGETIGVLDEKVRRCHEAGANIVIIPAAHMDGAENHFPDIGVLERKVSELRSKFPHTIHTPQGYFSAYRQGRCSAASIIIAADGRIYYPCHILGHKGPCLVDTDLSSWLRSGTASMMRREMSACARNCGWYQYYSIASYVSLTSAIGALKPMLLQNRRKS